MSRWVKCPVCQEPDMQQDASGRIDCTNLACSSNHPDVVRLRDRVCCRLDKILFSLEEGEIQRAKDSIRFLLSDLNTGSFHREQL